MTNITSWCGAVAAILLMAMPRPAAAQELPPPAAEFAAGVLNFSDNAVVREGFAGAAMRFYLMPRISVGPEVAFVSGERHSHVMLTGNVTFDFLRPMGGRQPRVAPFAVVGGGLFRTTEEFPRGTFSSGEGAFTAGGGVRARVNERVFAGAEVRLGWELHIRVNGMVGVQLGALR